MRTPKLVLFPILLLTAGLTPALAQLSGGVGSSNAANQAFQQQNALRGFQQQQTFNNNQGLLRSSVQQMNAAPSGTLNTRRIRRPERER